MKSTKNIFVSIVSIVALFSSQMSVAASNQLADKSAALLKQTQGPGFEVFNKATGPITITIFMNNKFVQYANIPSGKKFLKDIDVQQPMQLGVYNKTTQISTGTFSREITPQPDSFYEINAAGKTKYLTWNPAKSPALYPQTGTFMGISGKSDSGYPLGSNLTQSNIRQTK